MRSQGAGGVPATGTGGNAVESLVALVGGLIAVLRSTVAPEACPGAWAWATSVFGLAVGLLPTAGALGVAALRRTYGSRYGGVGGVLVAGLGLLTAGLTPLLLFLAAGKVFRASLGSGAVPGLTGAEARSLRTEVCFVGPQNTYLGSGAVGDSFSPADPVTFTIALFLLALVPLCTAGLVAAQARLALRRGPRWPAKFFWVPTLALTLLTAAVPAATAEHLWVGAFVGAFLGMILMVLVPPPSRELVRRSLERPAPAVDPARTRGKPQGSAADRLAERFARRSPEPVVQAVPRATGEQVANRAEASGARATGQRAVASGPPTRVDTGSARAAGPPSGATHVDPAGGPAPSGPPAQAPRALAAQPGVLPPPARAPGGPQVPAPGAVGVPLPPGVVPGGRAPASPPVHPGPPPPRRSGPVPPGAPVRNGRAPRFRLIQRIGAGGFGRVWLAHDAKLGHTVALKSAHAPDAETEERIRREAAALAAVRHPLCVRVHDLVHASADPGLGQLEGLVIVMQYVEGTSLGKLVQERGPVDDVAAARIWSGVAGALDAAHQQGVLHRDIKPGNVIVDRGGRPYLIDFGIARRTGDSTLTQTGFVLGTPDYLAPEVAAGKKAGRASDVWQLAATISYSLTGYPPRGGHADAISGLRAAATGAKLTHLPRRTAHLSLLKQSLRTDPNRRPDLGMTIRVLDDWLRRAGVPVDGPVGAASVRR